ncbi:MAG: divalent metal cation transporter [Patescibacteria group bacterium]|jgi:NRAMP (natural resistance-associated macrophage protein)-like metal ion transporter
MNGLNAQKESTNIHQNFFVRAKHKATRFLHILGPGLVTGAADDDPSGIATYSQAGANYGTGLLWAFPVMFPLLLAVQETCSRIGAVTGKGLAANLKAHYSKTTLLICVSLVVLANTVNIGSDLGAMAAATELLLPIPFVILAIGFAVGIIALEILIPYKVYAHVLKWLAIALFAYPVTAFVVGQDWSSIFAATFTLSPKITFDSAYILVGMIGTTVSPYLFFWDTSQVVEEEISKGRLTTKRPPTITKQFLRSLRIDNFVGMTLASVTAWFIVIVCASVLFANGVTEIDTAADAARALEPLVQNFPNAGLISKIIFSSGIVGLGLLAIPTLAGSASYAISETMDWKEGLHRKFGKAIKFYSVIIIATLIGLGMNFLGIDPIKALVFTAVFNGVAAIPLLFMILRVGNNADILGEHKNGIFSNLGVLLALIIVTIAALFLFYAEIFS